MATIYYGLAVVHVVQNVGMARKQDGSSHLFISIYTIAGEQMPHRAAYRACPSLQ